METPQTLARLYRQAHDEMRSLDGLQPAEAFDELLKYLYVRQMLESNDSELTPRAIRKAFSGIVARSAETAGRIWPDATMHLSDRALAAVHLVLRNLQVSAVPFDVRSAALREFIGPDVRRGLGIYLTPDDVVRAVVRAVQPPVGSVVLDPACGTGTFLVETARYWKSVDEMTPLKLVGADVNARMTLIAEMNLSLVPELEFHYQTADFLDASTVLTQETPDYIFTNPPFGVYVDKIHLTSGSFATANAVLLTSLRIPSEVLFVEKCLRILKPGGVLAIVLPRSFLTNKNLEAARREIDKLASLIAVMNLPPETFSTTGTLASTAVLFLRRRVGGDPVGCKVKVGVVDVHNVGYDSTGRRREGSDLPSASEALRATLAGVAAPGASAVEVAEDATLAEFGHPGSRITMSSTERRLGDLLELAGTGRTPARQAYLESPGVFTIKVGNLSGHGIDWLPRDRNFVVPSSAVEAGLVRPGDILLTSSAHNPRYIAAKVDLVHTIPPDVGGKASFTAEVMRLRLVRGGDPFALLGFLRSPVTRGAIQRLVRGQTAHLRPDDLLDLPVPAAFCCEELRKLLVREAELSYEMSLLALTQRSLLRPSNGSLLEDRRDDVQQRLW